MIKQGNAKEKNSFVKQNPPVYTQILLYIKRLSLNVRSRMFHGIKEVNLWGTQWNLSRNFPQSQGDCEIA